MASIIEHNFLILNGTSSLFEIQFSLKLGSFIEFIVTKKLNIQYSSHHRSKN
jgi:hypothetical protein